MIPLLSRLETISSMPFSPILSARYSLIAFIVLSLSVNRFCKVNNDVVRSAFLAASWTTCRNNGIEKGRGRGGIRRKKMKDKTEEK